MWYLPDARVLCSDRWFWTSFSICCFGGESRDAPPLHTTPRHCVTSPGHDWLDSYQIHEDLWSNHSSDTEVEAEYPWDLCLVFAEAVAHELAQYFPEHCGVRSLMLNSLIRRNLKGATKGLQSEAATRHAIEQVFQLLDTM